MIYKTSLTTGILEGWDHPKCYLVLFATCVPSTKPSQNQHLCCKRTEILKPLFLLHIALRMPHANKFSIIVKIFKVIQTNTMVNQSLPSCMHPLVSQFNHMKSTPSVLMCFVCLCACLRVQSRASTKLTKCTSKDVMFDF